MWYRFARFASISIDRYHDRSAQSIPHHCKSLKEIMRDSLFHGSGAKIEGPLRGGGYDDILWTAEDPQIAQNYISKGMKIHLSEPNNLKERVRPTLWRDPWAELAKTYGKGYPDDIEYENNQPISYRWKGDPVTYDEIIREMIEGRLGYEPDKSGGYEMSVDYSPDGSLIAHPANYRSPGQLFIGRGKNDLKIYDMTHGGDEGDITDPQYHHLGSFDQAKKAGYDGVKIADFLQSANWGNVGHPSIGLFPRGIKKMNFTSIPATHWDWPDDKMMTWNDPTPELRDWHKRLVLDEIERGAR